MIIASLVFLMNFAWIPAGCLIGGAIVIAIASLFLGAQVSPPL